MKFLPKIGTHHTLIHRTYMQDNDYQNMGGGEGPCMDSSHGNIIAWPSWYYIFGTSDIVLLIIETTSYLIKDHHVVL